MRKIRETSFVVMILTIMVLMIGCSKPAATEDNTNVDTDKSTIADTDADTDADNDADIDTDTDSDTSISVTDMTGQLINLETPATKIVALTASDCEILYSLGAGDTLVGRGEYCNYPEEVADIQVVQSGADTNIEQIIALQPQVVVMSTMAQTTEQITALNNAGVKVVVSDAKNIAGVYEAIKLIGAITGKDIEAETLINQMQVSFDEISANADAASEKTIYFEISPLEYGLWTAGNNTFMNEIAEMLGMTNIFADIEEWAQVSEEQVLERNPDYIFTVTMYYGEGPRPEEEIMEREGWQNVSAVMNQKVFTIDSDELTRPGPRLADAAKTLSTIISKQENIN